VWAAQEDLSGREWFQAMQTQSTVTTRFRIRYRSDVSPKMRVSCGGKSYEIEAALDPDGTKEQLHLMCGLIQETA